ncbi:MAG: GNAT family N-acetyltransferase [Fermentimonas sp.]|jgi:predicted GNAT family acetyltransferase|nr:GNAT family N-acetyltransferase [Fermentimonas sp.]
MEIQRKINNKRGSFFIMKDGRQVAELDFNVESNILDAYHTGVRPDFEGQGIAGMLFDKMVEYARKKGYKVNPSCPYILAKFRRDPESYKDLWSS